MSKKVLRFKVPKEIFDVVYDLAAALDEVTDAPVNLGGVEVLSMGREIEIATLCQTKRGIELCERKWVKLEDGTIVVEVEEYD